ncbi:hypothetical protein EGH24_12265 [Halonotius terrestris]|uniref:Uncharacterized protein n=1 Tax=Halonotius terrestris TaxID=2487750 RepID=A0A8J8PA85_9EURY|nr:hypothetical protein [Halonotius terrestris]TQQ79161.1 hypothetical protein EGH24_12265 [Halonotius terrestris]
MVDGGRNLEKEIIDSFFEEVRRDDSIPDDVAAELERLENQDDLTDSSKVIRVAEEVLSDVHSED